MSTTDPNTPTAVELALRAAGAEMGRALADVSARIVATTALGQIMAGLPDAARGMIEPLKDDQKYQVGNAALELHQIATDATPEGRDANREHASTTEFEAQTLLMAGIYRYALLGRRDDWSRRLDQLDTADIQTMYRAARVLLSALDARLPQTGPDPR